MMAQHCIKWLPRKRNDILFAIRRTVASGQAAVQSTQSSQDEEIIIPKRIHRSSTDILKALSATVNMDPTAPHYKFIDDPYLIPQNKFHKTMYALSKESGRKAAKYFLSKYPELFTRDEAEPKVNAFHFRELLDESMDLNEEDLKLAIANNQVDNAMVAFKTITKNGGQISDEVKQDLLELLCYFNSCEAPDPDLRESFTVDRGNEPTIWSSDLPQDVFQSMTVKNNKAYGALIAGLVKQSSYSRALELYAEARKNDIGLTVEGYNALLVSCIQQAQSFETRWSSAEEIITEMNKYSVAPNLYTFNALFELLSRSRNNRAVPAKARSLMSEMKRCGVEPSLGTFCHLIRIFHNSRETSRIIDEILDELQHRELVLRHPSDLSFFPVAMAIANETVDLQVAYRLHHLLTQHRNYLLLGTSDSESGYYNAFFKLLIKAESIDKVMEIYYRYVPNTFVPDYSTFFQLVDSINLHQAYRYLPQICSDFLLFEMMYNQNNVIKLLTILAENILPDDIQKHVSDTAFDILRLYETKASIRRGELFTWDSLILDKCLKIFTKSKDFKKARKVLEIYSREVSNMNGQPSYGIFHDYIKTALFQGGSGGDIIMTVKAACEYGNVSVLKKTLALFKETKVSDALMQRMEDIQSQYKISDKELEASDDLESPPDDASSSSSSDSSDGEESNPKAS